MSRSRQFIPSEVLSLDQLHLRHGRIRLAVVVACIPEEKSNATLILRGQYLNFDVFRRISLGPPAKSLQPGTDNYAAALGDFLKALHRFADKMLRCIPGTSDPIHPEEM